MRATSKNFSIFFFKFYGMIFLIMGHRKQIIKLVDNYKYSRNVPPTQYTRLNEYNVKFYMVAWRWMIDGDYWATPQLLPLHPIPRSIAIDVAAKTVHGTVCVLERVWPIYSFTSRDQIMRSKRKPVTQPRSYSQ